MLDSSFYLTRLLKNGLGLCKCVARVETSKWHRDPPQCMRTETEVVVKDQETPVPLKMDMPTTPL